MQPQPIHFKNLSYQRTFIIDQLEDNVWKWLNDPATFTKHQIWPYKVEFIRSEHHTNDFQEGVHNTHHGPFISFTGVMGEVKQGYRDLQYYYGSYFLSMRAIRPYRLQFWSEPSLNGTKVTLQLDSYVAPRFYKFWNWSQGIFWKRFEKWMKKSVS